MNIIEVVGGFLFISLLLIIASWAFDEWRNRR